MSVVDTQLMQDAYLRQCASHQVHANSALQQSVFMGGGAVRLLDLSDNLVGPRGLRALQPLLPSFSTTLHTLILAYNDLDNTSVMCLARCLASGFPALRVVNLSGNPFTFQAAKQLANMCEGIGGTSTARSRPAARESTAPTAADQEQSPIPLLTPAMLFENGLSYVGQDNNIDQVVLQDMPLLTPALCECVLSRIDAAMARRQERKRKLKAFERQARRRSTVSGGGLGTAVSVTVPPGSDDTTATPQRGAEEEFPDDVARTPFSVVGDVNGSVPTPVAFLEQEAAGQLQVDVGMPKAPQIPDILLSRKVTPQRSLGSSARGEPLDLLGKTASDIMAEEEDADRSLFGKGTPRQSPQDTAVSGDMSWLGASAKNSGLSPRRPPLPRPSPRGVASPQAQPSFRETIDDKDDEAGWLGPHQTAKCGAPVGDPRVDLFEDNYLAEEEQEGDKGDHDDSDENTYEPDDDHEEAPIGGIAADDDWLFTGALEPLDFTPPGSAQAGETTLPPLTESDHDVMAYDAYVYASEPPTTQNHAGQDAAVPGFLDDLQFDLGAMDAAAAGDEAGLDWMAPTTATAATPPAAATASPKKVATALFGDDPVKSGGGDDGAPSWLDF